MEGVVVNDLGSLVLVRHRNRDQREDARARAHITWMGFIHHANHKESEDEGEAGEEDRKKQQQRRILPFTE